MKKSHKLKTDLPNGGKGKSVLERVADLERELTRLREITKFFRNVSKKIFS